MEMGVFLEGQARYCICTNSSHCLSATAEFLVFIMILSRT